MRCEEIMKRTVECLAPTDTIQDAARRMRNANVGFLPVCNEHRKVLGVLTDRDIAIRVVADGVPITTRVEQVMTREVVACRSEEDIRRAQDLMGKNRKSRILVVDEDERLVGVISLSDIAQREESGRAAETMKQVTAREAHPS